MLNIILFGPPGAGKGTQSVKLAEKYNLLHLSTGDVFRAEMKAQTELGKKAKSLIEAGQLVPDEITIGMVRNKVKENSQVAGFIFDGFPRTTAQADALDDILKEVDAQVDVMLSLEVAEEELVTRLLERGKVSGRADDQDEKVIRERLAVYNKETAVLKEYYAKHNKAVEIKGTGSIDEVFDRLAEAINAVK